MGKIADAKKGWLAKELEKLANAGVSKAEVARRLGMLPQTLNNILNRDKSVSDDFIDKFSETLGISLAGLFGEAPKGIPLIPMEAVAGQGAQNYQDSPVEDYYSVKEFTHADFLIRVKGDSMTPKYKSGDLVACQNIEAVNFWQWHAIYVIATRNQGVLIKRVEPGADPDSITCVSENPVYRPFQVPKEEIVSVASVLGSITLE